MIGRVLHSETKSRMVTVVDVKTGAQVANLIVPINIQGVTRGCTVTYDKTDGIVTSVLAFETNCLSEDYVPGPKSPVQPTTYDNRQSSATKEGDILLQRPNTGFLYLLRGIATIIGASPLSKIVFDGTTDAVTVFMKKLRILDGDNIDISILSDTNTTPVVKMKLGKLELASDTDSMFTLKLDKEAFYFSITKTGVVVKLFGQEIFNKNIASETTTINLAAKLRSQLVNVAIDIVEGCDIKVGTDAKFAAQSVKVTAMKVFSMTGQTLALLGTSLLRLDGQNITMNAKGNAGSGGDVNIKAGALAGLSMKGISGSLKLRGNKLELLGVGESLANGNSAKQSIDALYKAFDVIIPIISAAGAYPPCAALSSITSANAALAPGRPWIEKIPNSHISVPIGPANGPVV